MSLVRPLAIVLALLGLAPAAAFAQAKGPLRIEITEGVIEPLPYAVPEFVAENRAAADYAPDLTGVIAADLSGTGLFREIPANAYISKVTSFDAPVQYADWKAINAQALITGAVKVSGGQISGQVPPVRRVLGPAAGPGAAVRRRDRRPGGGWRTRWPMRSISRITGEGGYFDSRVVFVSETGPKVDRKKRLAVMDYDGANIQYLTDASTIVLAPRFSPMATASSTPATNRASRGST